MTDVMFIEARYEKEVRLNTETLNRCKKHKVIALYASVQFISRLPSVIKQLEEEGILIITSKPDRTDAQFQILGCDSSWDALRLSGVPDAFLYIGDGLFHPRALVLAQKENVVFKEIIQYDPMTDSMRILRAEDCKKIFKKYKANLMKYLHASVIGVIISLKPGQQQWKISKTLHDRFTEKQFYFFLESTIDYKRLEDFPFVQIWINTACTRMGYDDAAELPMPMINVMDAFRAEQLLSKKSVMTSI
ncbi:diphthamide synthesis protein [Candidatus Woesearchaeota archaeon]|nr:diphthamide synthesis protein [Candidatus Woesearchaeota archaeon]